MARLKPGAYRNTRAAVVMCAALIAAPALAAGAQMPLPAEFQDVALLGEIVTDDDVEAFGFTSAQGAFIACSAKLGSSWVLFTPPLLPDTGFSVMTLDGRHTEYTRRQAIRLSSEMCFLVGLPEEQVRWACQSASLPQRIQVIGSRITLPIALYNPTNEALTATLDIPFVHTLGWGRRYDAVSVQIVLPPGNSVWPVDISIPPPNWPTVHQGRLRLKVAANLLAALEVPVALEVIGPVALTADYIRPRGGDEPGELKLTCRPLNDQGRGATVFLSGPNFALEPLGVELPGTMAPTEFTITFTRAGYKDYALPTNLTATVVTRDGYSFRERLTPRYYGKNAEEGRDGLVKDVKNAPRYGPNWVGDGSSGQPATGADGVAATLQVAWNDWGLAILCSATDETYVPMQDSIWLAISVMTESGPRTINGSVTLRETGQGVEAVYSDSELPFATEIERSPQKLSYLVVMDWNSMAAACPRMGESLGVAAIITDSNGEQQKRAYFAHPPHQLQPTPEQFLRFYRAN